MEVLELTTLLLILASLFSLINLRLLKLPTTIGLMILAIFLSISVLAIGLVFPDFLSFATSLTKKFDFSELLVNVMLPFLLFAGAISVDVHELLKDRVTILFLASFGVLFSTVVVGSGVYWISQQPFFWHRPIGTYLRRLFAFWGTDRPHRPHSRFGHGQKNEPPLHYRNPYCRRIAF